MKGDATTCVSFYFCNYIRVVQTRLFFIRSSYGLALVGLGRSALNNPHFWTTVI